MRNTKINTNGFTLIELVIAVAILAFLITIAVPSYQSYLRDGAMRTAGQTMLKDAKFMETWRGQCGNYAKDTTNGSTPACFTDTSSNTNVGWPDLPYTVSPESGTVLYRIAFSSDKPSTTDSGDFNGFRLMASPIKGTIVANSKCVCVDQDNNILYGVDSCNNGLPNDDCISGVDAVATGSSTPAPSASSHPTPTPSGNPTPTPEVSNNPTPTPTTGQLCSNYASWASSETYTAGNQVSYQGYIYTANWWTQSKPSSNYGVSGSGKPWARNSACNY